MKNLTKTLNEKYQNNINNDKAKLSRFLKRRRMELGKTLEEVSEGVCSTSYLSKIENCLVDVDESYFQLLFEKLNLEYHAIVEERKTPIYEELLKAYLSNNVDYIEKRNIDAIKTNSYSDTEIEIALVLYNLVNGSIEEAFMSIEKLAVIQNTLSTEELVYLGFLKILYYTKTYQNSLIQEEIEILLSVLNNSELLYYALLDLALDYYFSSNQKVKFTEYFSKFNSNKYIGFFKNNSYRHQLQRLVFLSSENLKDDTEVESDFLLIKETLNEQTLTTYYIYYAIYLINKQKFEQAYLVLDKLDKCDEVLALMGFVVDKLNNMNYQVLYLKYLEEWDDDVKSPFVDYIEYVRLKFEQYSYGYLYSFLKNRVLDNQKIFQHYYLKELEYNEFYSVAFELGKYKEIARSVLNK